MLENFRYKSEWEDFEKAVRSLQELLESGKVSWEVGYITEFGLYVDGELELEELANTQKEAEIIEYEILVLILRGLTGRKTDEKSFYNEMISEKFSEEEAKELAKVVSNKFELVMDTFDVKNLKLRYDMKKTAVSHKLSGFNYNIVLQELKNGEFSRCTLINMGSQKRLDMSNTQGIISLFLGKETEENITWKNE